MIYIKKRCDLVGIGLKFYKGVPGRWYSNMDNKRGRGWRVLAKESYPSIIGDLEKTAEKGSFSEVREDGTTMYTYVIITKEEAAILLFSRSPSVWRRKRR